MSALCAGMTPWESPLRVAHPGSRSVAGNQEMPSRAGTDGMARRQASGLGAKKVWSLELTKLTCPWKSLLGWHFLMEIFCLCLLRNSTAFEQQAPSLPGWICHLTCSSSCIGLQGKDRLQVGQHHGVWQELLSKGHLVPSTGALGIHSRRLRQSQHFLTIKSATVPTQFLARLG